VPDRVPPRHAINPTQRALLLIDGIGPFFRHYRTKRINWSKIPFSQIETEEGIKAEYLSSVPDDFERLTARVSALGFTGVTLDDLAHLHLDQRYPAPLRTKIEAYRGLFRRLLGIARDHGLSVFLTTDVTSCHPALEETRGRDVGRLSAFLARACDGVLSDFPEIGGVITRFGEADGRDVRGDFRSRLALRTPADARLFLSRMLPVFESKERLLVFRTWSLGAYPLGDLIWNRRTYDRAFSGIDSRWLVVSMKYGETDFFRFLPTNPLLVRGRHLSIVELQARREFEGFGAYPSFVGWDAERHLKRLAGAQNVVGISVWCQTGGWGRRRQLTYLRNSSPWVELNVFVISRLWSGASCEEAIAEYCRLHQPPLPVAPFVEFLRLSDQVIEKLLYIGELGERPRYFRRLRLPPQFLVFWDRIIVSPVTKQALEVLVQDPARCLREGREALAHLDRMRQLARDHDLPAKGLEFQYQTYQVLAAVREYLFGPAPEESLQRLRELSDVYRKAYGRHYAVSLDVAGSWVPKIALRWLLGWVLREQGEYRMIDQVVTLPLLPLLYPLLRPFLRRLVPAFAERSTMGIDPFFR
jgi:hypothetical protein